MDIAAVIDRLKTQVAGLGNRVAGAAELAAALNNTSALAKPHAFVIWTADTAQTQSAVPGQKARFAEQFTVVLATDNTSDPRGQGGAQSVESLSQLIIDSLVGWEPVAGNLPVTYDGSSHVDMNQDVLFHAFEFSSVVPGGSIMSYIVNLGIAILPGVTTTDVINSIVSKLDTAFGADTRLDSDYMLNREAIPEDSTRYQLRFVPNQVYEEDANTTVSGFSVQLRVYRHIAPGTSERTYTEGLLLSNLATILPPTFWEDPLTLSVEENPALVPNDVLRE